MKKKKKAVMKEVCRGDGAGNRDGWVGGGGGGLLVGVSASELEPMKSETGQARAGDAVTATHSTRLGLMSSTSRSWHKLCLPHTHTHTRMHTHKVKCNLCALHYYSVQCLSMAFKSASADVYFTP